MQHCHVSNLIAIRDSRGLLSHCNFLSIHCMINRNEILAFHVKIRPNSIQEQVHKRSKVEKTFFKTIILFTYCFNLKIYLINAQYLSVFIIQFHHFQILEQNDFNFIPLNYE